VKYLLDTDICVFLIRRQSRALIRRIIARPVSDFAVSQITVAELHYGAEKSLAPLENWQATEELLVSLALLDFDYDAAITYGSIRRELEAAGTPIGALDMLIAAQALSRDLVLLTHNLKEFKRVPGLTVEDWTRR
jgi:tRNA(fMet)-specific endonuclease VapC